MCRECNEIQENAVREHRERFEQERPKTVFVTGIPVECKVSDDQTDISDGLVLIEPSPFVVRIQDLTWE